MTARPRTWLVPTHLAWSTGVRHHRGWVHTVVDAPLRYRRLVRAAGDPLCRPRDRFLAGVRLQDTVQQPVDDRDVCSSCAARQEALISAGAIEHPCGRTGPGPIPHPDVPVPDDREPCPRCGGADYGPFFLPDGGRAAICMDCDFTGGGDQ